MGPRHWLLPSVGSTSVWPLLQVEERGLCSALAVWDSQHLGPGHSGRFGPGKVSPCSSQHLPLGSRAILRQKDYQAHAWEYAVCVSRVSPIRDGRDPSWYRAHSDVEGVCAENEQHPAYSMKGVRMGDQHPDRRGLLLKSLAALQGSPPEPCPQAEPASFSMVPKVGVPTLTGHDSPFPTPLLLFLFQLCFCFSSSSLKPTWLLTPQRYL